MIYQNLVESPLDVANCTDSAIFLVDSKDWAVETFGIITKFGDPFIIILVISALTSI